MTAKPIPDFNDYQEVCAEMVKKVRDSIPFCHVRYADGEFQSILGRTGPNADGQEHLPHTLGRELKDALLLCASNPRFIVGGNWIKPPNAWDWMCRLGLDKSIRWCHPQVFVGCVKSGETMELLKVIRNAPGNKYLVANSDVQNVRASLNAHPITVTLPKEKREEILHNLPHRKQYSPGAYDDMPIVRETLDNLLKPGDIVIWCAGLGCKPSLINTFLKHPLTTHIDMGCFFDPAVGLNSRSWTTMPQDVRWDNYMDDYTPRLLGKVPW